jgi:hypothetical protein
MFKSFGRSYGDLGRETFAGGENGSADHRGEPGFDEHLAAYYDKNPMRLRVAVRLVNPI